jgi:hypothetical protein
MVQHFAEVLNLYALCFNVPALEGTSSEQSPQLYNTCKTHVVSLEGHA